jgi:hypothetical protein
MTTADEAQMSSADTDIDAYTTSGLNDFAIYNFNTRSIPQRHHLIGGKETFKRMKSLRRHQQTRASLITLLLVGYRRLMWTIYILIMVCDTVLFQYM